MAEQKNSAIYFLYLHLTNVEFIFARHNFEGCFLLIFTQRGAIMNGKCDWPCWEIMNCDESKKCLAKIRTNTPCWELARERSDYRYILQICVDCIVHVLKGENNALTKNEIQSIMVHKASCVLTSEECLTIF